MEIKKELLKYKSEEIITHTSMSGGKYNIINEKELYDILDKYEEHDITEKHLEEGAPISFGPKSYNNFIYNLK